MAKYIIKIEADGSCEALGFVGSAVGKELASKLTPYKGSEQEKPKRWRAKKDGDYFYIKPYGEIVHSMERNDTTDDWSWRSGNYFHTYEEAEEYKESLIVYNELKAYAEPDDAVWNTLIAHWYIGWDANKQEIHIECASVYKHAELYFPTKKAAQAAVEAVGEDRVKRYYLGIKEQEDE